MRLVSQRKRFSNGQTRAVTSAQLASHHVRSDAKMMTVDLQAKRSDVPAGGLIPLDVAVECRFDHGVVVDFHWIVNPLGKLS